jgi:hypothetical protein
LIVIAGFLVEIIIKVTINLFSINQSNQNQKASESMTTRSTRKSLKAAKTTTDASTTEQESSQVNKLIKNQKSKLFCFVFLRKILI